VAKVVLIRNPKSGRGKASAAWPALEAQLKAKIAPDLSVQETKGHGHATELARQAVSEGCETIIAYGGDGTVTQTANGLIGSAVKFGIIPGGTGNDLSRTLGIGTSTATAVQAIEAGKTIKMDVARWKTDQAEGYFLNIAGMGFDAAVAERINQGFKSLKGTLAYLAAVISTLQRYRSQDLRLTIDGAVIEESVMLSAVANAQCYGGGMKVAPMASVTDGILDVVLVRALGRMAFLTAFPKVFKGAHMGHPKVDHYRGRQIRLEPRGESPFLIDGELTPCRWAEIEVMPGALEVFVP
jgi:diacylglycerol kinase (ATP)